MVGYRRKKELYAAFRKWLGATPREVRDSRRDERARIAWRLRVIATGNWTEFRSLTWLGQESSTHRVIANTTSQTAEGLTTPSLAQSVSGSNSN